MEFISRFWIKDVEDSRVFSAFSMAENSYEFQILALEGKII
jgi:hypothetical protein